MAAVEPVLRSGAALSRPHRWQLVRHAPLSDKLALGTLALITLLALLGPTIAPHDPLAAVGPAGHAPSWQYPLGTDEVGRDMFSRVLCGLQTTWLAAIAVIVAGVLIGGAIGLVAGATGGWIDTILMRITDVFLALPKLILALAFTAALGPGIEHAIIAIAIASWPGYARIARAETLTIRNSEYVAAIQLQGASTFRIIGSHILPLLTSSLIIRVTLDMAGIILTAAGLGFIGLGAQPPLPEWGAMISRGRSFILDQWWVATMPGFAIVIVSLGFCFLGDGLRDVLDPKHGERQ